MAADQVNERLMKYIKLGNLVFGFDYVKQGKNGGKIDLRVERVFKAESMFDLWVSDFDG